jgi:hypothetical protein
MLRVQSLVSRRATSWGFPAVIESIHTPLEQPLVHTIATKGCFLSSFRDGDSAIHCYGPPFIEPSSLGNIRVFEILQASAGAESTGFALVT